MDQENHINVRLGFTEVGLMENWFGSGFSDHAALQISSNPGTRHWLSVAGIFPHTPEQIKSTLRKYSDILTELSALGPERVSYSCTLRSAMLEERMFGNHERLDFISLNPCKNARHFQKKLKGKKICVITPFPESFAHQCGRLSTLFDDARLEDLDTKDITFIKSPPHKFISTKDENPFESWDDALNHLSQELDKAEYDVLLTGCGAFSLPLNHQAWKAGKTAINMGGDLQLMFGVKGKRWNQAEYGFNENWISPLAQEVPELNHIVEGGAYW